MTDHAASLTAGDRLDIPDVERRVKAIFIGSIGNLVEWCDFYAYTAFALYRWLHPSRRIAAPVIGRAFARPVGDALEDEV